MKVGYWPLPSFLLLFYKEEKQRLKEKDFYKDIPVAFLSFVGVLNPGLKAPNLPRSILPVLLVL